MKNLIKNPNIRIPLYFVTFFVGLAILDGIFVYTAVSSHRGVVTENAYEKGLKYNEAIEKAEKNSDIAQNIEFEQLENTKVKITYSIDEKEEINKVTLNATRPIVQGKDFEIDMDEDKDGSKNSYSAIVDFKDKGNWDLLIIAQTKNAEFRKKQRIFIK